MKNIISNKSIVKNIMVDEVPDASPKAELSDEEILKRAEEIKKAQEAKKAEELKRAQELQKAEEARKAEEIRKAEEAKKAEERKKAEELKKARALVEEDDARKAEIKRKEEAEKEAAIRQAEKKLKEENKAEKPKKKHTGLKVFIVILVLLAALIAVVAISADVNFYSGDAGYSYPYSSTYEVWLPIGKEVSIFGYKITALSADGIMLINIGGVTYPPLTENLVIPITNQKAVLSIFWGKLDVMSIQYHADMKYIGNTDSGKEAYLKMQVLSSRPVPEMIMNLFMPNDISYRAASTF